MAIVTLIALLVLGVVCAENVVQDVDQGFLEELARLVEEDGFDNVTTVAVDVSDGTERKKRSVGYGGCGGYPGAGVSFVSCFRPGNVVYQNNHVVHNYYRTGTYGTCQNYFNALPLTNVHPVAGGYTGQLLGNYGRSYSVSACGSCYGGYPGIGIRCNTAPYSYLSRRFVFKPTVVNNVNVNNYNHINSGYGGYAVGVAPVAPVAVGYRDGGCHGGNCGGGFIAGCHGGYC